MKYMHIYHNTRLNRFCMTFSRTSFGARASYDRLAAMAYLNVSADTRIVVVNLPQKP